MRNRPFGVTDDSTEESGGESQLEKQMETPQFCRPIGVDASHPEQRRNGEETHNGVEVSSSKHKRNRDSLNVEMHNGTDSTSTEQHRRSWDSVDIEMTDVQPPIAKKHKKKRRDESELGNTAAAQSFQSAGSERHHRRHHHRQASKSPAKKKNHIIPDQKQP